MIRSLTIAAFAVAALGLAGTAKAEMKPEEVLKMRQGLFQAVKVNFGPLAAVAKGEAQLSDQSAAQAANVAALTRILPAAFAKGTESIEGAKTKPEAWTSAEFTAGFAAFATSAEALAKAAAAKDMDGIKAAVGEVGKTCKGCHDNFRVK